MPTKRYPGSLVFCCATIIALFFSQSVTGDEVSVSLANDPALSADGKRLAFTYGSDLWTVATKGGVARRFSTHPASESQAKFSPDGKRLAFISNRTGSDQVWVQTIDAAARPVGVPVQVTHHSEGYQLHGWYPDNQHVLVSSTRDAYWYRRENNRFFKVAVDERRAEQLLFDAHGTQPSLSPDGHSIVFQREGVEWWRKGYQGSRAAQIWRFDSQPKSKFTELIKLSGGDRSPLWKPCNTGFYFVSQRSGTFNLWEQDFAQTPFRKGSQSEPRQLTNFSDDAVLMPALSADGSTIVFRQGFDFYSLAVNQLGAKPQRIRIRISGDPVNEITRRRTLSSVDAADTTPDGLEWAVAAGGDLWVTDTELREPINVTDSANEESEPRFVEAGKAILFLRQIDGNVNLWRAERTDQDAFWWQQSSFQLRQLTHFPDSISHIKLSPSGCQIAYVQAPGNLYVAQLDGSEAKLIFPGFSVPSYEFSPDGRWIALAQYDNDFNRDIWIVPTDGSHAPVNVSRHPKNDDSPQWSPDGRILAFTGIRDSANSDLFYVYLKREDADSSSRDRKLEKAIKKIQDARREGSNKSSASDTKSDTNSDGNSDGKSSVASNDGSRKSNLDQDAKQREEDQEPHACAASNDVPKVEMDLEDIHRRVRRVRIEHSSVSGLFWFAKDQTLGFQATIDGDRATYTIEFPDKLSPKKLSSDRGSFIRRLQDNKSIAWLQADTPGTLASDGKSTKYPFSAQQQFAWQDRFTAGFNEAWRLMRDSWYDDAFGNRNWDAIRRKYADVAARAPDQQAFATVIQLMLGELNGSHLGFTLRETKTYEVEGWQPKTAHLGVRFDPSHVGRGWLIRDVLTDGPADRIHSRLHAGEIILAVDDVAVDSDVDATQRLNGSLDREIKLLVRARTDQSTTDDREPSSPKDPPVPRERVVMIRPISWASARSLLYPMWEEANRQAVEKWSHGKLGYLHIEGMNMTSLYEFERQLFNVGFGKEGLVIDVRGNGGGSTTDHLLTALTQPRHAITVPRGGGPGYPQDRKVYATWDKPIIVLCNQNSFSNAEIFSHAIRLLKRGKLVGVSTAGGVISTGSMSVLDLGTLRRPSRGWFALDSGRDMELNGARPHVEIWPLPGEMPSGRDRVLERAVNMLSKQTSRESKLPQPKLIKASDPGHRTE